MDDRAPVLHPDLQQLLEPHGSGPSVDQGHVVDGEGVLQGRVLEELAQHLARVESRLDLDDQAGPVVPVGQVDGAGDALQLVVAHPIRDAFQNPLRAHHEGQLGDHDGLLAGGHVLQVGDGPGHEGPSAVLVGLADAVPSHDDSAAGQIRAGHVAHELVQPCVRVSHQILGGGHHLAQVVGDHVGGHAHGDARGPVDQQVGDGRGQDLGLLELVVVVGGEVHRVLVDVGVHAQGRRSQPGLGVAGGGRSVVQGSEVAVAVDQGQAHGKGLGQPDHGLVDG